MVNTARTLTRKCRPADRKPSNDEVLLVLAYAVLRVLMKDRGASSFAGIAAAFGKKDPTYLYIAVQSRRQLRCTYPTVATVCHDLRDYVDDMNTLQINDRGRTKFDELVAAGEAKLFAGRDGDCLFTKPIIEPCEAEAPPVSAKVPTAKAAVSARAVSAMRRREQYVKINRRPTDDEVVKVLIYHALRPAMKEHGSLTAVTTAHKCTQDFFYRAVKPGSAVSNETFKRVAVHFPDLTSKAVAAIHRMVGGSHPAMPTDEGTKAFDALVNSGEARLFGGSKGDALFTVTIGKGPTHKAILHKKDSRVSQTDEAPFPTKLKTVADVRAVPKAPTKVTAVRKNLALSTIATLMRLAKDPAVAREFINADRALADQDIRLSDALEVVLS